MSHRHQRSCWQRRSHHSADPDDFVVLGQPVRFAVTEWRVFAFFDSSAQTPSPEPTQLLVQGERPMLHSITAARADQRITILAERRPGSADLFVLAVDLCP